MIKYNFVALNALQELNKDAVCGESFLLRAILYLDASSRRYRCCKGGFSLDGNHLFQTKSPGRHLDAPKFLQLFKFDVSDSQT